MPICSCKQNFNPPCSRDIHNYNWESRYCCRECWRASIEYRFTKTRFMKLYKSLNDLQKAAMIERAGGMSLDYLDEIYYWLDELRDGEYS
jgi:hypothetical protein